MVKQHSRTFPGQGAARAHGRLTTRLLAGLMLVRVLAACDGSATVGSSGSPPAPLLSIPAITSKSLHGHFRGAAAIGEEAYQYHAEALITVDGEVRLYIAGPVPVDGVLSGAGLSEEMLDPAESMLLIGSVGMKADWGLGQGVVIGERCAAPHPQRFCAEPARAEISITGERQALAGEIRIITKDGEEVWRLRIGDWSFYYTSMGRAAYLVGTYTELLAPFAQSGDTIITIDSAGRLFFQSPTSGCTGNGTSAPHLDGSFYVFDVDLIIENCDESHAYLNGRFEGLATATQDNYWGYDQSLLMFLSTPGEGGPRAAVTTLAARY